MKFEEKCPFCKKKVPFFIIGKSTVVNCPLCPKWFIVEKITDEKVKVSKDYKE